MSRSTDLAPSAGSTSPRHSCSRAKDSTETTVYPLSERIRATVLFPVPGVPVRARRKSPVTSPPASKEAMNTACGRRNIDHPPNQPQVERHVRWPHQLGSRNGSQGHQTQHSTPRLASDLLLRLRGARRIHGLLLIAGGDHAAGFPDGQGDRGDCPEDLRVGRRPSERYLR